MSSVPPRVRLAIPGGWFVRKNELRDLDPAQMSSDDERWWMFSEDLAQIYNPRLGILVDVGWYPDASPAGHYGVKVIVEPEWDTPLLASSVSTLAELISLLETQLSKPPAIPLQRLFEGLRDPDPERRSGAALELALRSDLTAVEALRNALRVERDEDTIDDMQRALHALIDERKRTQ